MVPTLQEGLRLGNTMEGIRPDAKHFLESATSCHLGRELDTRSLLSPDAEGCLRGPHLPSPSGRWASLTLSSAEMG